MSVVHTRSSFAYTSNKITCWSKQISISVTVTGRFHLCSHILRGAHVKVLLKEKCTGEYVREEVWACILTILAPERL